MNYVKVLLSKLGKLFLAIMGVIRRALCCRRRYHDSEMLLPLTTSEILHSSNQKYHVPNEVSAVLDLQSWDVWNEENQSSSHVLDVNNRKLSNGSTSGRMNSMNQEYREEEEDYFRDMIPAFRRPKKYVVHHSEDNDGTYALSSRLSVDVKAPVTQDSELGLLDENISSWEDNAALEDAWDVDSVIKEKRLAERERRIAENLRKKQERESKRVCKNDSTFLTATKS